MSPSACRTHPPSAGHAFPRRFAAAGLCTVLLLLAGCAAPPPAALPNTGSQSWTISTSYRQDIAMAALSLIGTPYRWGGDDPERGLDCSGLVSHVFRQVTGRALPHNASRIAALARDVPRAELAPGDLVFFDTLGAPYSHMGIYLGENRFLHAPSRGGQVRADKLTDRYYASRLTATKTLFGA